jgi:hypothetical protein
MREVRHALILKDHQAGQVVLKMAKFRLIIEQIAEGITMRHHYRSRGHDWQDHYPPSSLGVTEVGKSDPMLYRSRAEGKTQQSSKVVNVGKRSKSCWAKLLRNSMSARSIWVLQKSF